MASAWKQENGLWARDDGYQVTFNAISGNAFVKKPDQSFILAQNGAPKPFIGVDAAIAHADQTFPPKKAGWGFGLRR